MTIHETLSFPSPSEDGVLTASATSSPPAPSDDSPDPTTYLSRRLAQVRLRRRHRWFGRAKDAHLGYPLMQDLVALHDDLTKAVHRQIALGATVHRRLPWVVRQVPWVVAALDCVVLFSFCADIFNVTLTSPLDTPVASLAAVLLSLLGGGIGFTWLAMTGLRLRGFRTELGEIAWAAVGALTWLMVSVSAVLLAALATLMYARVGSEVLNAVDGSTSSSAGALGVIFAILSIVANLCVVAVHALDGSTIGEELSHAGRLLFEMERRMQAVPSVTRTASTDPAVVPFQRSAPEQVSDAS